MKALVGAFNQGKAIVRGLLPDCEIFANVRLKLYPEHGVYVYVLVGLLQHLPRRQARPVTRVPPAQAHRHLQRGHVLSTLTL